MKQKKVLAISFSFPPDNGSGAIRNLKILKYVPSHNWSLTVLTHHAGVGELKAAEKVLTQVPSSVCIRRAFFLDSHKSLGAVKRRITSLFRKSGVSSSESVSGPENVPESKNGSPDEIAETKASSNSSSWEKSKEWLTFWLSVPDRYASWIPFAFVRGMWICVTQRPAVIYAVGKPWSAFFVGYLLKRLFFRPLVIDFMDPWNGPSWGGRKGTKVDLYLERFICRRADHIIANTGPAREDFITRLGQAPSKVGVITCGFDKADFPSESAELALRDAKPLGDKFVVLHAGTFYQKRSPKQFLAAVKKLLLSGDIDPRRIEVRLIGRMAVTDSESLSMLEDVELSPVLNRIEWRPHSEVLKDLAEASLLLLVQPETRSQIPAKIYEYAAARRPVLALAELDGAVAHMIAEENWGTVAYWNDVDAIATEIKNYYDNHFNSNNPSKSSRGNVDRYSTEYLAGRLVQIFEQFDKSKLGS